MIPKCIVCKERTQGRGHYYLKKHMNAINNDKER